MKKRFCASLSVFLLLLSGVAFADAGSTLRLYKDTTVLEPGKKQPEQIQYDQSIDEGAEDTGSILENPSVVITNINVVGNTLLSAEELHKSLSPHTGRPLTTQDIHEAADNLMQAIRNKGAFAAKVYILPQDIVDNTITFNVIEGHLAENGIMLGRSSERVKDRVLLDQLKHTLKPGSIITADKYERAIYLTNDLPGIAGSENLIFPAEQVGEAGFEVIPEDENLLSGDVYYDNFGSTFTGRNQFGTTLEFNSPFGHAERITAGAVTSDEGTVFGYLDANAPLYPNGLRGGFSVDSLDYKTNQENGLRGTGFDGSLYLRYPIIRSRLNNLYSELSYTYSALKDEDDLSTITDRELHVGSVQIYGDLSDSLLGGGVTTYRMEGYIGEVDLDGYEPYKEYDAQHADTQGSFSRATLNLTRLQHLIGNLQGYAAFHGQLASGYMDSAQSISFGGPYDFPGYHSGEIFGDEGWMTHVDLRYNIETPPWQGTMQMSVFYDYGYIKTHTEAIVDGFPVPGATERSFHLQSTGFGLIQNWDHVTLQGILGWQVNNKIENELLDDGGEDDFQAWISMDYHF